MVYFPSACRDHDWSALHEFRFLLVVRGLPGFGRFLSATMQIQICLGSFKCGLHYLLSCKLFALIVCEAEDRTAFVA